MRLKPTLNRHHILLICLIFTYCQKSLGQTELPRIIVGISAGPSFPKGKFESTELFDEKAGFAQKGIYLGVDASYQLEKNYGVCGAIRIGSHPLDVQQIANGYARILGGIFTVKAQRWIHSNIFGGAFITIPIKRVSMDLRMMPGIVNFSYPEITAESDQYQFSQRSLPSKVIGFCAGGAVRYKISENFSIALNAEIMRAKPSFVVEYSVNGDQDVVKLDQPVSLQQAGLCLYYNIY